MMAWASAWGKWFSAQLLANQDRPIDKEGVDRQVMQIAASLVTDAAMDGKLEVRGRRPDGISYEVIPREAWRLIALVMHPDLRSLWRAALIPRGRLIPLSQVDQYLGLAGRSETGLGSTFSGGLDRSARMPVAVLRRRGSRRSVGTPLRGLSRPTISQ
jgi:hypothetical protein